MKRILAIIISLVIVYNISAQGKYAGSKKLLIGKVYTDSKNIKGLTGWAFVQGSVLNPLTDPEMITVDVFKKGATCLVIFSFKEDTASDQFAIADILEVKPVVKGWAINTTFCRQDKVENSWIVAWVKGGSTEYLKTLKKAWRFNPDKRRIEITAIKGIDCLNENTD